MIAVWLISTLAALGGLTVFVGLCLEKRGSQDRDKYENVDVFRRSEHFRRVGERFVRWGVFAEMLIGFGIAAWGGWQELENNPLNRPIASVYAIARFEMRGTNFRTSLDPVKDRHFVTLSFAQSKKTKSEDWVVRLVCKSSEMLGDPNTRVWYLEFGQDPWSPMGNLTASDSVATADNWDIVVLEALFLRKNAEILNGEVTVFINTTVKHFPIPPQLANPMYGPSPPLKGNITSNRVQVVVQSGP